MQQLVCISDHPLFDLVHGNRCAMFMYASLGICLVQRWRGTFFQKNENLKILGLLTAKHSAWLNIQHAVNISRFLTDI